MRTETVAFVIAAGLTLAACGRDSSHPEGSAANASPVAPALPPAPAPAPGGLQEQDLSKNIPSGAPVQVQLKSVLDSSAMATGFVAGTVADDVKGTDGRTAIPAGSPVTLYVRGLGKKGPVSEMDIGLYSVNVMGKQYSLSTGPKDAATLVFKEDAGRGPGHSAVHLYYDYRLDFRLDTAVQLR